MCFVCVHFAAHKRNLKARNTDYHKIIQKLTFVTKDYKPSIDDYDEYEKSKSGMSSGPELSNQVSMSGAGSPRIVRKDAGLSILTHDVVYFLGDINYRLEFNDLDEVYQLIRDKNWTELLARDQLLQVIENGYAFADFHEERIEFQPTFKYLIGTDEYEQIKKRTPSYCDRILWKIKKNNNNNATAHVMEKEKEVSCACIRYNCC
eukprot:325371_1